VAWLRLALLLGVAAAAPDAHRVPALLVARIDVVRRIVADIEATFGLQAQALEHAAVELGVRLAEA
jgi:hypothetical protein